MSYVPKPYFWSRIGSPWLRLGSNLARMNPTASRNLLKPLPALREPISVPKFRKQIPIYRQTPDQPPQRLFIILRAGDLSRHTQNLNALILTWRNLVRLILCNLAHPKGRARESSAVPRILHIGVKGSLERDISSLRAFGLGGGQISRVVHVSARAPFGVFAETLYFLRESTACIHESTTLCGKVTCLYMNL